MSQTEQILRRWKDTLCANISVGGMLARNPIAHKWKATYRSLVLRESVSWRTHDLLTQAQMLYEAGHVLGSRILIRGALESVATLIYLNQLTARVLAGTLDFQTFEQNTSKLLLGSRDRSTKHMAKSIVSVLEQCEKKFDGITGIYATLSECAHPNYEGICFGYSNVDYQRNETNFSNKWASMWGDRHESLVKLVCAVFETEYNDVWKSQMEELEAWLTKHDAELVATKDEEGV